MKQITEQRRQELIEHCKRVMGESSPDGLEYPMAEIALASLTAVPEYFQWKWARDENASWTTTPIEQLENAVAAFGGNGENVNYRMQYTSPPVPVIKLPDAFDDYGSKFDEFRRGYNECIAEVERLNGLGE